MLIPMNLHNQDEYDELIRQRKICGWDYEPHILSRWRDMIDHKQKSLFWILHPNNHIRAGQISLDSHTIPEDLDLANPDKSLLTISTFFVLPEFRSLGLGSVAVGELEELATKEPYGSPHCKAIALTALSKRYTEDDGDDWRGIYARMGLVTPPKIKGRSIEDWYARKGYVKWKDEPKYTERLLDGTEIKLVEAFMRKEL